MRHSKLITTLAFGAALLGSMAASSCNSDSKEETYADPSNLAVRSFALKSNSNVSGLDSAYFSIDLEHAVIFNADSLRKGTSVSKVVADITFGENVNKAEITMTGGDTRVGTIDYRANPSDSIDFSGDVTLTVGAEGISEERTYRIKVNVHKQISDTLVWDKETVNSLPSRLGAPTAQKTVSFKDKAVSLITEKDGSHTLATSVDLLKNQWEKKAVTLSFRPDVNTLEASDDALYILSDAGRLYRSADMETWQDTGKTWRTLIGGYLDTAVGLAEENGTLRFAQYPAAHLTSTDVPSDFPVKSSSNFVTLANKWTSQPVAFFAGGTLADGTLSDATWAFDGAEWVKLSSGGIPAVEGASLVPYYSYRASSASAPKLRYSVWMILGGKLKDGEFNRTVYISYDNGVSWNPGAASLQLPETMPAMTDCDNVVLSYSRKADLADQWTRAVEETEYTVKDDVIYWNCPYIFLFGGYDADRRLYDTIWRGVLTRLTFTPII